MFNVFWLPGLITRILLLILFLALAALTCIGLLETRWNGWLFPFRLVTHWTPYVFYAQVVLLLICLPGLVAGIIRKTRPFSVFNSLIYLLLVVPLLMNGLHVAGFYLPSGWPGQPTPSSRITILHMNVLGAHNREFQKVSDEIRRYDPDILSLQEFNPTWQQGLAQAGALKPYKHKIIFDYGNAVFSKLPLRCHRIVSVSPGKDNTLIADILLDGKPVSLITLHPVTPLTPATLERQQTHLKRVIQEKSRLLETIVLVGDLNTTPWAESYRLLTQGLELHDTQRGFGVQASWPTFFPIGRIAIDHVLTKGPWQVKRRELGHPIGSDHLPVYAELRL